MANPIISRVELEISGTPLTTQGVVRKTGILLAITAAVALGFFFFFLQTQMSPGFSSMIAMGGIVATFMIIRWGDFVAGGICVSRCGI